MNLIEKNNITDIKPKKNWRKPTIKEGVLVFALIFVLSMIAFNWGPIYQNIKYAFSTPDYEEIYYRQVAKIYRNQAVEGSFLPSYAAGNFATANIISSVSGNKNVVVTDNYIEIPKLGVKAPIIETSNSSADDILTGLKYGVVRYVDGGVPYNGQTIILGHSSSRVPSKYGSVFALLGKLEADDVIHVKYNGQTYSYFVKTKEVGSVDELKLKSFAGDLVLTSCWPPGTDGGRITISAIRAPLTK